MDKIEARFKQVLVPSMVKHCMNSLDFLKHRTPIVLVLLIFFCMPSLCLSDEYSGHCFFMVGQFIPLGSFSDAYHIDSKMEAGISFDLTKDSWPVSLTLDTSYLYATSERPSDQASEDILMIRSDMSAGIKKIVNMDGSIKPFVAGGVYLARMYSEIRDNRKTSMGLGYFISAGIILYVTEHFSAGIQWKYSDADMTLENQSIEAGGNHLMVLVGYRF